MNIPWEEQPTPEHVWIEDLQPDDGNESGWYTKMGAAYVDMKGDGLPEQCEGHKYKVHHRPEPEFKQGDLVDVTFNMPMDDAMGAKIVAIKDDKAWVEHEFLGISEVVSIGNLRKHGTERDKFIRVMMELSKKPISTCELYDAGFRYTGDKE